MDEDSLTNRLKSLYTIDISKERFHDDPRKHGSGAAWRVIHLFLPSPGGSCSALPRPGPGWEVRAGEQVRADGGGGGGPGGALSAPASPPGPVPL